MPRHRAGNRSAEIEPLAGTVWDSRYRPRYTCAPDIQRAPKMRRTHTGHAYPWQVSHGSAGMQSGVEGDSARSGRRAPPWRARRGGIVRRRGTSSENVRGGPARYGRCEAASRATGRRSPAPMISGAGRCASRGGVRLRPLRRRGQGWKIGVSEWWPGEPKLSAPLAPVGPPQFLAVSGTAARRPARRRGRLLPRPASPGD